MTLTHEAAYQAWLADLELHYGAALELVAKSRARQGRLNIQTMARWLEMAWEAGINAELRVQHKEALQKGLLPSNNGH